MLLKQSMLKMDLTQLRGGLVTLVSCKTGWRILFYFVLNLDAVFDYYSLFCFSF